MKKRNNHNAGFLLLDAIMGIFLLGVLGTAIAVGVNLRYRATQQLANQRAAILSAQQALADLQAGRAANATTDSSARISIARSGKLLGSREWIEVTAHRQGRTASLVGLVPSVAGAAPVTQPGGSQ